MTVVARPPDPAPTDDTAEAAADPADRRRELLTGAGIAVAALWAGLWRLDTTTILFDEPTYAQAGRDHVTGDRVLNLEHPPLAKYGFGLAQSILGEGIASARVVSALAGVVIALVVWRLGTEMFGRAVGVVAAGLWIALPRSIGSDEAGTPGDRLERFAYLEPVTAMWMTLALWFGWRLHRHGRRLDAVALGVAIGAATASKVSGVFVAIPIALFLLVVGGRRHLLALVTAAVVSGLTFLATYAPFGRTANEALDEMIRIQRDHAEAGHAVFVNGESTNHPPWYTELWYHLDADGPWLTAATVVLVVIAMVAGPRLAAGYLLGAVTGLYLLLSLLPVELRHYRFVVWPPLVILLAAGAIAVAGPALGRWRVVGAAAVVVVVVVGSLSLVRLATIGPEDYAALAGELDERGVGDEVTVAVFGPRHVARHHLPDRRVLPDTAPETVAGADIVLVDRTHTVRFGEPEIGPVGDQFTLGRVTVFLRP